MKIDFKKLKRVESEYSNHSVCLTSLQNMVQNVIQCGDEEFALAPSNIKLSIETLIDLGIVIDGHPEPASDKKIQQLNS